MFEEFRSFLGPISDARHWERHDGEEENGLALVGPTVTWHGAPG